METIYTLIAWTCYGLIFSSVFNIALITIEEIKKEYF